MSKQMPDPDVVGDIAAKIEPILCGHHPLEQSAALAELLAQWLAGWPDFVRDDMLEEHMDYVRYMVGPAEKLLYCGKGHPQNKGGSHANRSD